MDDGHARDMDILKVEKNIPLEGEWMKGKIVIEMAPWEATALIIDLYRHRVYRDFVISYTQAEGPLQELIAALQEALPGQHTNFWVQGRERAEKDIESFKHARGIKD